MNIKNPMAKRVMGLGTGLVLFSILAFAGTRIPTFEETLALMPRNVWLNCHLKGDEAVGRAAAAMLKKTRRLHQAFLTCSEKAAQAARQAIPGILICNGENRYRRNAALYADQTIKMKAPFIQFLRTEPGENRREVMKKLKQNNVTVNYFYAKIPDELAGLFAEGVDFVLVNDLAKFQPEAERLGIPVWKPKF